ncbi:AEC family transporter [uncultured Ferrovibrio sp.]|mgnify:CR=1 FL=1|jgi:malonate transporter|uniref:AEC family transporter n=1 Tax=uncultured Ferrovibrio sp. TaxID=1576913 RepID=UPI002603DC4B|nr:AEC family transporter [uncultured Ferrovibrio sp.]
MLSVVFAIVPIFLLIAIGTVMKRGNFPGDAFWPLADKTTYFLFFPALLIDNLSNAKLGDLDPTGMLGALFIALLLQAGLVYLLRPLAKVDGPGFTSVFQGAVRFNTFVGLGAVAALEGGAGITLFAVAISLAIPVINVMCVLTLARYGAHGQGSSLKDQVLFLIKNPLIIACLIGIALNVLDLSLPPGIAPVFKMLGSMAAPMGLLTVGAGLQWEAARAGGRAVGLACALKLLIYPVVLYALSRVWGLGSLETKVLVLWGTMPTASASYILARQMGGDAPLAAAIITVSTILAFITVPIFMLMIGV